MFNFVGLVFTRWVNLFNYIIRARLNATFFFLEMVGISSFAKEKFMIQKSFQDLGNFGIM